MNFEKWLQAQKELDDHIIETKQLDLDKKVRLTNTTLALMVEVAELANETRSFKHWSNRGPSENDVLLAEFSDVMHFLASIANQLGFTAKDLEHAYFAKHDVNYKRQKEGY